ncbi:hypothetical protein KC19_5G085000 [Ceratodon purpureus]|uniref:Uncharacterized protein n=1 Tax=Ceratodon purpureus TaxID=3225 RepID=A0A8T0I034_CERPU|nr:hypothetical protein KC19_5G085000 [Ceratodon purpureus]
MLSFLHLGNRHLSQGNSFRKMAVAMAMTMAGARPSLFEQHPFVRLLELPATTSSPPLPVLQTSRGPSFETINGVVTPDLPIKASLIEYFHSLELKHILPNLRQKSLKEEISSFDSSLDSQTSSFETLRGFNCWQVRTVAAQTRSLPELQERMIKSSHEIEASGCGGSLLLLSGGHPLRRVWFANQLLPANSFVMLKAAHQLRKIGLLSPGLQLWCVENPLVNSIERLEQKINAGAEAVVVQPPLLPERFAEWWSKADQRGLTKATPVIVGLPLLTSSRNYSFWLELTGASGKEADAMKARWKRVESEHAGDSVAFARFCYKESVQLIESIRSLPGVAGIHVMPVTRAGWRQYQKLVSEGRL